MVPIWLVIATALISFIGGMWFMSWLRSYEMQHWREYDHNHPPGKCQQEDDADFNSRWEKIHEGHYHHR